MRMRSPLSCLVLLFVGPLRLRHSRAIRITADVGARSGVIPIYAFDGQAHHHMQHAVYEWALEKDPTFRVDLEAGFRVVRGGLMNRKGLGACLAEIKHTRPKAAVWLLDFRQGDRSDLLKRWLEGHFREASSYTRNVVFHWAPEKCDLLRYVDVDTIVNAYSSADYVFQFAYMDERLASQNSTKYLPWPLGTAAWRRWSRPKAIQPMSGRALLAGFLGSMTGNRKELSFIHSRNIVIESAGPWQSSQDEQNASRYQDVLSSSKLAICPWGHHPNSYRIMEAVESGAIPVIQLNIQKLPSYLSCYSNWAALYGLPESPSSVSWAWIPKAPFHVLQNWSNLQQYLERIGEGVDDGSGENLAKWYRLWRQAFLDKLKEAVQR